MTAALRRDLHLSASSRRRVLRPKEVPGKRYLLDRSGSARNGLQTVASGEALGVIDPVRCAVDQLGHHLRVGDYPKVHDEDVRRWVHWADHWRRRRCPRSGWRPDAAPTGRSKPPPAEAGQLRVVGITGRLRPLLKHRSPLGVGQLVGVAGRESWPFDQARQAHILMHVASKTAPSLISRGSDSGRPARSRSPSGNSATCPPTRYNQRLNTLIDDVEAPATHPRW